MVVKPAFYLQEKKSQIAKELQLLININLNTFTKPRLFQYIGNLGCKHHPLLEGGYAQGP